jgi:acyl-CoA synthetase (AMP-forming)/AMP-acid ligase II
MIHAAAARAPDAVAVETPDRMLSYAALMARVNALAAGLQSIDPTPLSRVGICAHNTMEHLVALLAVLAAEKTWVPLNPRDAQSELDAKIDAARPTLVVVDADCTDKIGASDARRVLGAGGGDGGDTVAGLIAHHSGKVPARSIRSREDTQAIKFTGGSSGRPKGVKQPFRAWLTGAACMIHELGLTAADRYLVGAPITHGTSCYLTPTLAVGGTLVLGKPLMRPGEALALLAERAITISFLPPTLIYMMMEEAGEGMRFPALTRLIYGAAPMPPERIRAAQRVFGPVIATNYGQTEAPQVITYHNPADMMDEGLVASIGRASFLTRVAVLDGAGRILPANEDGEVAVSGDLVMTGYLDMPEATAESLKEGWLRTGDIGTMDPRGYVFLKDRVRDLIITGGFNVYPSDVEAALVRHPAVRACVVFGIPDDKWGEAVNATVVLRDGAAADEAEIITFAKRHVGSVKAPKRVHFRDELPISGVGKVMRRIAREAVLNDAVVGG